jgi:hypothetical protein
MADETLNITKRVVTNIKAAQDFSALLDKNNPSLKEAYAEPHGFKCIFQEAQKAFVRRMEPILNSLRASNVPATGWAVWNDLDEHARIVINDPNLFVMQYHGNVFDEYVNNIFVVAIPHVAGKPDYLPGDYYAVGIFTVNSEHMEYVREYLQTKPENTNRDIETAEQFDLIHELVTKEPEWLAKLFCHQIPYYTLTDDKAYPYGKSRLLVTPLIMSVANTRYREIKEAWSTSRPDAGFDHLLHDHNKIGMARAFDYELVAHYITDCGPNILNATRLNKFGENLDSEGDEEAETE